MLILEAKNLGEQSAEQWAEQILALRQDARSRDKELITVAVGGLNPRKDPARLEELKGLLGGDPPPFYRIDWGKLRGAVDEAAGELPVEPTRAVLADIAEALDAWGYRILLGFDSLPAARGGVLFSARALDTWTPTGPSDTVLDRISIASLAEVTDRSSISTDTSKLTAWRPA